MKNLGAVVGAVLLGLATACVPDDPPCCEDSADSVEDDSSPDSPPETDDPVDPVDTPVAPGPCEGPVAPTASPAAPLNAVVFESRVVGPGGDMICLFTEDLDRDGHLDVGWVPPGGELQLRWGRADGAFDEASVIIGPERPEQYGACTPVPGLDGSWDVLVGGRDGVYRLRQQTPRHFVDVGAAVRLPAETAALGLRAATLALVDLDRQGELDLIVGIYGKLPDECVADDTADTDVAVQVGPFQPGPAYCLVANANGGYTIDDGAWCPATIMATGGYVPYGVAFHDLDADGAADAVLPVDFGLNVVLKGRPSGGFDAWPAGHGMDVYNHGMGSAVADFDQNGRPDVFVTDISTNDVYRGVGCDAWFHANDAFGTPAATQRVITWGAAALDLDRSGADDLFVTMSAEVNFPFEEGLCDIEGRGIPGAPAIVLLNNGLRSEASFQRVDVPLGEGPRTPSYFQAVHMAPGDHDHDGRPDVVVAGRDALVLLLNRTPAQGHFLRVQVVGADGRPSFGAQVRVTKADGQGWEKEQWPGNGNSGHGEMVADFGLGTVTGPFDVEVRWPDGTVARRAAVAADQLLVVGPPG